MTDAAEARMTPCEGCGLEVDDGATGCHRIFEELLARDFSNPLYFGVHRMMVDSYCLQHPERYCRSAKSFAAHLTSLCSMIEGSEDRAMGADAIRHWLDGPPRVEKPELPAARGELTIDHLRGAETPEQHSRAVEEWARSTWAAYGELHDLAHQWLEEATLRPVRA